jgi:hypothetical protein
VPSLSPVVDVLADVVGWDGLPTYLPDWSVTERLLGLPLPDDYEALLNNILAGKYAGTVLVGPPAGAGQVGDLMARYREVMKAQAADPGCPYPLHPEVPGLVPRGWTAADNIVIRHGARQGIRVEVVKRPARQGFQALPRRWIVERTWAG